MSALPTVPGQPLPIAGRRLTDLIDRATLQSIQDTFARTFGLPTVIVHPDGTNVTDITHRLRFCEDLTRGSAVAGPRCADCDVRGMAEAAGTGRPAIFKCWNGLYDCAIPIAPKGDVLGYFLCGQVFDEPPDERRYRATAAEIGVDENDYADALREVRRVDFAAYEASVESMQVLAEMIAEQAGASIDSLAMLAEARQAEQDAARLLDELETILEGLRDVGSQPDYRSTLESVADNLERLIPCDSCLIYFADDDADELVPVVARDPYPDQVARHRPRKGRGVVGRVAVTGVARRFSDITHDPDFEPIPGVPVEPESALVVPMTYKGTISGVISLSRFERRTFTDRELRVLNVFSSQASVSIQVSKLASDRAQRLQEERAIGRLLRAMSSRTGPEGMFAEIARAGAELLHAEAAVVAPVRPREAAAPRAAVGLDADAAAALLERLAPQLDACADGDAPAVAELDGSTALVLPLRSGDEPVAVAAFVRAGAPAWDLRLAESLAAQASLGVEKSRMHEREHRLLLQYRRLSELGTELARARDADEVRERLLAKTPEIVEADLSSIAVLDDRAGMVAVELHEGRRTERFVPELSRRARLAGMQLREGGAGERSLFDAWAEDVFAVVRERTGAVAYLAEPLSVQDGVLGGLFAAWRSPAVRPLPEHRRLLGVLAAAAGSTLGRFAAYMETDSTLRERVAELEALNRLAQRLTSLTDERPIVEELLAAFRAVGSLEGAMYAVRRPQGLRPEAMSGLDDTEAGALAATVEGLGSLEEQPAEAEAGGRRVLAVPISRGGAADALLVGVGGDRPDAQRERVLATLAHYGSVALENASLHARQREAIIRLERTNTETAQQYESLQRILSVHELLSVAVLEGRGLQAVADSLAELLEADLLIVAPNDRVLAGSPPAVAIGWRPQVLEAAAPHTVVEEADGVRLVAAPAVSEGAVLAWVIARPRGEVGEVERAAVEYGALLTALDLLRERTAIEVESRLRGGLLEELFDGAFVDELMLAQGKALGFDLERPSRVFLVEPAPEEVESGRANGAAQPLMDPKVLYGPALECARDWGENVVALRGGAVALIVHERADAAPDGASERFEDLLCRTLGARLTHVRSTIAVGTSCTALADYRRSYQAARRGLDLLRLLGRAGEVFSFRETSVEHVLLQSTEPSVVLDFVRRYVEPLERHDASHATSLRASLEAYFACGHNLEEAARRLHVHVSTLRYRLKKVNALLGVDIRDTTTRLDIEVALRAAAALSVYAPGTRTRAPAGARRTEPPPA